MHFFSPNMGVCVPITGMDLLIVCECASDLSKSLKLCSLLRHFFFPNMVVCVYTHNNYWNGFVDSL
ncbi:hypothetical protein OIU77_015668 [Salix suchowensis]|uniref:Uncharacterized protein n=1 Tax=Salix suchowensis TaxID=1278906 RepID=A0ABQ8ZHT7_9ROSI|nr:hypothetical protein OIU77_015668 [Salix suchowensis]